MCWWATVGPRPATWLKRNPVTGRRWNGCLASIPHTSRSRSAAGVCQQRLDDLRIVNAEGDDLEFCAAEYRVDNEAALISALEAAKEFESEEEGEAGARSFAWLEQGAGESHRAFGSLRVRHGKMRLECNSRARLETGRRLIEKYAGASLLHVRDTFHSMDAVKRKAAGGKSRREKKP